MIRSTANIKKEGAHFENAQNLIDELIFDVTMPVWEATMTYIREREYDGTIVHTYVVFDKESGELSQIFAADDLTTIEDWIYNYSTVRDFVDAARKKGWRVRFENS
jgi:hypothetical protein